ncbi:MAG: type II toxin-antitoxin system Phd/YefM family antitoxin [Anaerolineae bacterium]
METVSISDARKRLAELTDRVEHSGERIIIERHGKPVVGLVSAEEARGLAATDEASARERRLAALERARALSQEILARRGGVLLPDSAESIREMREQRDRDILRAVRGE